MSRFTIAHVVNPFKCTAANKSNLFVAQPITFESMRRAVAATAGTKLKVRLFAVGYPEDASIVPAYMTKLPSLTRSAASEFGSVTKRKLPLVADLLNAVAEGCPEADIYVLSNSDIALRPAFYLRVAEFFDKYGKDPVSCVINRRDIPKANRKNELYTVKQMQMLYTLKGKAHPGYDCFAMNGAALTSG